MRVLEEAPMGFHFNRKPHGLGASWGFLQNSLMGHKLEPSTYSLIAFKCHKSNINNCSEIVFIFLPTFYLIIWLMTSPKHFEKMSIFKI